MFLGLSSLAQRWNSKLLSSKHCQLKTHWPKAAILCQSLAENGNAMWVAGIIMCCHGIADIIVNYDHECCVFYG